MNKATKWYARLLYAVIAVALVAGLTLVPALVPVASPIPIVEANVSNVNVTVANPTKAVATNYTINFTTTVKLTTAAADTITVEFPTGTTANTSIASVFTTTNVDVNGTTPSSASASGTRVSITPNADVNVGKVTINFTGANITNPNPEGNYTLKVYTSQEPTAVTSAVYIIDTILSTLTVNTTPQRVNHLANYTINFTTITELTADVDTITIIFPATTTVPASIAHRTNITVAGTSLDSTANYSASEQTVTLTVPGTVSAGINAVNISTGAGFKNPTAIRTNWTAKVYTSKDRAVKTSDEYTTLASNQSAITQVVWDTYDSYVPNNTPSSVFYIRTLDVNGANATVNGAITFVLGATNGAFYSDSSCSSAIGTKLINASLSKSGTIYYKCTSPGTQYLTARDLSGNWTTANQTVLVNPMLELWGGGSKVSSHSTFGLAIAAALPYDTIKVPASTYQEDIIVNQSYLTIESISGPASTTVIIGTSTYNINITAVNATIDGLHLQGDGSSTDRGIYVRKTGFTIKNCIINNTDDDGIMVESSGGAMTSGTIDNCTITGTGGNTTQYSCGIIVEAYSDHDITGVTISNNTISHWGTANNTKAGGGISVAGGVAGDGKGNCTAKVINNTITNCRNGLGLRGDLGNATSQMTGANATANNTLSDCYLGVFLHWTLNADYSLIDNTISNNTLCGIYLGADGTLNSTGKLIKHNNIYGNGHDGINNTYTSMTADLVATYNWWGNASGPGRAGPGTGDNVTTNVTYSPWLSALYPGGNATTNATLSLKSNWNFISVPKKLENATFGWLLSGISFSTAWGYNASSGQWVSLTNSSAVEVLYGYWVDSNEAATVNLTFIAAGQQVPASKALTGKNWNAIGFSDTTAANATMTLMSVNTTWSTALGWNATAQSYDASIVNGINATSTNMNPCKGYWLWMTADDTLSALSA